MKEFGLEHGLPSLQINDLTQDHLGFIWLATSNGIARFDGYDFTLIKPNKNTLSFSVNATSILEVENGVIWFVTNKKDLIQFEYESGEFTNVLSKSFGVMNNNYESFHKIKKLDSGEIWILGPICLVFDKNRSFSYKVINGRSCFDVLKLEKDKFLQAGHAGLPTICSLIAGGNSTDLSCDRSSISEVEFNHTTNVVLDGKDQYVWAGTWSPFLIGINLKNKKASLDYYPIPIGPEIDKNSFEINTLEKDGTNIWVGTNNTGLFKFNTRTKKMESPNFNIQIPNTFHITKIFKDLKENIWIGTKNNGLYRLKPVSKQIENIQLHLKDDLPIKVLCFKELEENLCLIGTDQGLFHFNPIEKVSYHIPLHYKDRSLSIYCIYKDSKGRILLGTNAALLIYNLEKRSCRSLDMKRPFREEYLDLTQLKNTRIIDILEYSIDQSQAPILDKFGNKYFTDDSTIVDYKLNFSQDVNAPKNKFITEISDTFLLASCYGYGLVVIDETSGYSENSGLFKNHCEGNQTNFINKIFSDNLNRLWFLTEYEGFWRSGNLIAQNIPCGYPEVYPRSFNYFPFVGKQYAANSFDSNSYGSDNITDIKQGTQDEFFLTTKEGELFNFDRLKNTIQNIPSQSRNILGFIKIDENHILLASEQGVESILLNSLESNLISKLDGVGYCGESFQYTASQNLYLGGNNGFTLVDDLDLFLFEKNENYVYLKSVSVMGEKVDSLVYQKEINLPYNANYIQLDFSTIDFNGPELSQFQYRMKGLNDLWVEGNGNPIAVYNDLQAGSYEFEAKFSNNQQNWTKAVSLLSINVNPPYWETNWFYTLCLILIISAIYILYRYQLKKEIRLKTLKLESTILGQENERKRLSQDLHDDFGVRISALKMYINAIEDRTSADAELVKLSNKASGLVDDSLADLRNLLTNLSPKALKDQGLVQALDDLVSSLNHLNKIKIDFNYHEGFKNLKVNTELNIFRIVQELINNSLKHAQCDFISIDLFVENNNTIIVYRDNGLGVDDSIIMKDLGFHHINERIQLENGKLEWNNIQPHGVMFKCIIPLNEKP